MGFNPSCSQCRAVRVIGDVSVGGLIPARARAGVAAGILALGAFGTPVGVAFGAETETPGGDGEISPDAVPGGGDDGATPDDSDEGAEEDAEDQQVDVPASVAPPAETGPPAAQPPAAPPPGAAPSPPVAVPSPPPPPAAAPQTQAAPAAPSPVVTVDGDESRPHRAELPTAGPKKAETTPERKRGATAPTSRTAPAPTASSPSTPSAPEATAQPVAPRELSAPVTDRSPASDGGIHVVQRGESLWSIARDMLGPKASPAQLSAQVQRLWELNADAIGTGDPSVILAGQELRLR